MIEELCKQLEKKRKELGYSVEYVVEKTKLHPSVIKDIEAGSLSSIGSAYLKGFIKIYASFLGVDTSGTLDEIKTSSSSLGLKGIAKAKDENSILNGLKSTIRNLSPKFKKNFVLVLLGIILLYSFFTLVKFSVRRISQAFKGRKTVENKQTEVMPKLEASGELEVSLTAKKKCFLKATIDGKVLFEGVLNKGAIESWQADKELEFRISDGSAVHLEVNGKSIPTLSSIRKPIKSLKITPSGISVDK